MTVANGLRVLLAARKSRKAGADTLDAVEALYARQESEARRFADTQGHVVIHATHDTKSGTSIPWKRRELGPWMREQSLLSQYDAILISNVDRISRGTDADFHYIEHWALENRKVILVAQYGGFQYPAREGAMGIVDKQLWGVFKEAARREWEASRDRHAGIRETIRANGGAIGRPPFGYRMGGATLRKVFEVDPVNGPLAREAFQRVADGNTATSVAEWLTAATGRLWRVKRVIDMIGRTSYLGERGGHVFEPLVPVELWNTANAALSVRSIPTGGRRGVHAYSGVIHCACGAGVLYHHQATKNGKPTGEAKYRCSRGRRGIAGEARCGNPAVPFEAGTAAVDAFMAADTSWFWVTTTTGGDAARQAELAKIQAEMNTAITQRDMARVTTLAARYEQVNAQPAEPIKTVTTRVLDKTTGDLWAESSLTDQRAMLRNQVITIDADLRVWDNAPDEPGVTETGVAA